MKIYNLHIVRSPLQLINILEAIGTLSLDNNILLILDRKNESNTNQIQDVLNIIDSNWEKIYHIKKQSKSNYLEYTKLIKNIRYLKFENIFIGDIDSITRVIVSNIDVEKVFLVDDGTSTLKRHEEFLNEKKLSLKDKVKLFRFTLFGLKSYKPFNINFFSFFDLKQKQDEIIIKNTFENIIKQFKIENNLKDNDDDNVYILGQPIYNKEIKEEVFIEYLNKLLEYYKGKKCVYLKHRYEKPTHQIKQIFEKNDVEIHQNKYPIELEFLIRKEYPKYITGFFSTAIYTLSRIFKDAEIKSFYIEKKDFFNDDRGKVVDNYYEFFKQSEIDIV